MAVITQRENGKWQAKVRRDGWPSQSKTFKAKADAIAWARHVERDMDTETFLPSDEASRTTLSSLIADYRKDVLPKKRGKRLTTYLLARIDEEFGAYSLAAITPAMLSEYRDERLKAVGPQTVVHELGMVSRLYNWAILDRKVQVPRGNPASQVRKPAVDNERDRTLQAGEEALLLAALCKRRTPWPRAAFILALETAGRKSELLAMRWSEIDLQARTARLRGIDGGVTKNGDAWRDVPLSPRALALLKELPRSTTGRVLPITQNALTLAWKRSVANARQAHLHARLRAQLVEHGFDDVAQAREVSALVYKKREPQAVTRKLLASLESEDQTLVDLHFHDLRHCATTALASRLEMHELMKVTGHKTARLVMRYYHPKAADLALKLA